MTFETSQVFKINVSLCITAYFMGSCHREKIVRKIVSLMGILHVGFKQLGQTAKQLSPSQYLCKTPVLQILHQCFIIPDVINSFGVVFSLLSAGCIGLGLLLTQ